MATATESHGSVFGDEMIIMTGMAETPLLPSTQNNDTRERPLMAPPPLSGIISMNPTEQGSVAYRHTWATSHLSEPHPGIAPNRAKVLAMLSGISALVVSHMVVNWPVLIIPGISIAGPTLISLFVTTAIYLLMPIRRTVIEVAMSEFDDLGLSPEVIKSVIVDNRSKADDLVRLAAKTISPMNMQLMVEIAKQGLALIDDFIHNPSAINQSRVVLSRCMTQALSISTNYISIESRKSAMDNKEFVALAVQTEDGLKLILHTLQDQCRNNLNTTALEVDLDVTRQLLDRINQK